MHRIIILRLHQFHLCVHLPGACIIIIIESVDSISRDGPDIAILYVMHYKNLNNSEQLKILKLQPFEVIRIGKPCIYNVFRPRTT